MDDGSIEIVDLLISILGWLLSEILYFLRGWFLL